MKDNLTIQVNLERCQFDHFNPIPPANTRLQHIFEAQQISVSKMAQAIGYKNINKGCRRIYTWLRKSEIPNTPEGERLLNLLPITRTTLNEINSTHRQVVQSMQVYRQNFFAHQLLRQHYDLLINNVDQIVRRKPWFQVHLPYTGVFMYYATVPSIRLGQLLQAWVDGRMQLDDFMAVRVVGSPLSGSHRAQGFYRNNPNNWVTRPQVFPRLLDAIKDFHPSSFEGTRWSLGQVVSDLGGVLEPTKIYQERHEVGRYDYSTRTLTIKGVRKDLTHCFQQANQPQSIGSHFNEVTMYKQNLQVHNKILCHWNQDLPPVVAQEVATQLWA